MGNESRNFDRRRLLFCVPLSLCLLVAVLTAVTVAALALTIHHTNTQQTVQKYPRLALMANGQVKNARLHWLTSLTLSMTFMRQERSRGTSSPSLSITGEVLTETWPFVTLVLGVKMA